MEKFNFNNTGFISCSYVEASQLFLSALKSEKAKIFSHLNLFNFYLFCRNNKQNNTIFNNQHFFFEGIFLKLSMFLLKKDWLPDINGTDLFEIVINELSLLNSKIFLLGADDSTVEIAANNIKNKYQANVVGYHHGFYKKTDEEKIVDIINTSGSDILLSGMGFEKEIYFAIRNQEKLNVKIIWNVGGLFDFLSGKKKRCPVLLPVLSPTWR